MAGIITEEIISHVGRPRNSVKFCKVCGIELTFENCKETKKGSGSLRSKCRDCEKEQDRARHAGKYRKKHKVLVGRGPLFTEQLNKRRMATQSAILIEKDGKQLIFYEDKICEECGGIIRYDEDTLERICEKCGLVDADQVIYNAPNDQFTGKLLKSYEKSRYGNMRIEVNRDSDHDIVQSKNSHLVFDDYQPSIAGGTFDPSYSKWYHKTLKNKRSKQSTSRIEDLLKRYKYA